MTGVIRHIDIEAMSDADWSELREGLLRYAVGLGDPITVEIAEDLVHDALVKVQRANTAQRVELSANADAYLKRMIQNAARDYVRRVKTGRRAAREYVKERMLRDNIAWFEDQSHNDMVLGTTVGPTDDVLRNERVSRVRTAISKLGDKDRQILKSFYVDYLSLEEIANGLDIKPAAAAKRLSRARKRLKRILLD